MGLTQITTGGVDDNINIDSNTLKVDGTNNRVGIGTATAGRTLSVDGSIQVSNSTSGFGLGQGFEILHESSGSTYLLNRENAETRFYTNNTERLRIDSSGRVGIGTSAPDTKVHVVGSLKVENTSGTGNAWTYYKNPDRTYLVGVRGSGSDALSFYDLTADAERMRIDTSGNVVIGRSSALSKLHVSSINGNGDARIGGDASSLGLVLSYDQANATVSRITANPTYTSANARLHICVDGDANADQLVLDGAGRVGIGTSSPGNPLHIADQNPSIRLQSNSGSYQGRNTIGQYNNILYLECDNDNAVANSTIAFTVDATERMRITSGGFLKASDNASYYSVGSSFHEFNQSGTSVNTLFRTTHPNTAATQVQFGVNRAATSTYWFLQGISALGTTNDTEFYIRGDGQAYIDGAWNGGGADYAEYFEWSDGNTEAEDRRGISVVLDGDKIREAVDGEEPIGVISGNPSVVGDNDVDRWKNKYLRDDYGSYVLDEDGNRQLNPDYDSSLEYVQREDRPEWDTVGLMGKLRIRKGQITGSRWFKMVDVSSSVEEWLVR